MTKALTFLRSAATLCIAALFAPFAAVLASAEDASDVPFPASPRDLAAVLENRIVSGEGVVLPDADVPIVLDSGSIRLCSGAWPESFHARIGETFSLSLSPDSSRYEFRDAADTLFWTEIPDALPPDGWVASFRRASDDPSPMDPLFDPTRIVMLWNILGDEEPQPEDCSGTEMPEVLSRRFASRSAATQPEKLRFSAFSVQDEATLLFSAEWPQDEPPPGGVLDLYETDSLQPVAWRLVASFPATNSPASFLLDWPAATNASVQITHTETCSAVTNLMVSPLDGETIYTNVIWTCVHPHTTNSPSAFFRLGTPTDSDDDGLSDAFETLVSGTVVSAADTDGDSMPDGWEFATGLDPLDPLDAMQDKDGDGLPNVYEFHNGTNPNFPDFQSAPRIVAGGSGSNTVSTLRLAFSLSAPYSVIEIAPGIHEGGDWTGLWMPGHPVLVTSGEGGRYRDTVLRLVGSGLAAFYLDLEQSPHTAFQSLDVELNGTSGFQTAFWLGNGNLLSGPGAAGFFRNVHVRLGNAATGDRMGWFCRHSTTNPVILAGCTIDAEGATSARGVYAVDSPSLFLENCSFLNFPDAGNGPAYALQVESTAANWGQAPDGIPVRIRNCLFDSSFSEAYPVAPLTNGVSYHVVMENCIVPSPLPFLADETENLLVAEPLVDVSGHLASCSPAVNAGCAVRYATSDFDGEPRDSAPDIGADEYVAVSVADTDRDGLSNHDEIFVHGSNPFRPDGDGDGVPDSAEVGEGTDPADPGSVCFTLSGTVNAPDLAGSENAVLAVVAPSGGTWRVVSSLCPTSPPPSMPFAFPHLVVSGEPELRLALFVDADGDGEFTDSESGGTVPLALTGHETVVEVSFPDVTDDMDSDGIPDWWEATRGLCYTNAMDAFEDPDGDWLINLHEYWHDLDPFVLDGTNTVLSILARSIDDRIAGKNPATALPIYENYLANAMTNTFVKNASCWAFDIDFSCASPWNSGDYGHWRAGTLISPRHILYADHFKVPLNVDVYFVARNGSVEKRKHVARQTVSGTDICIGLLDAPVSTNVCIAKLLAPEWREYLGSMRGIPAFGLDQEEKAIVVDLKRALSSTNDHAAKIIFGASERNNRNSFFESFIQHDSGDPLFVSLGADLVLLGTLHTATSVDDCSAYIGGIQAIMNELCAGYSIQTLSFDDYPIIQENLQHE